MPPSGLVFSGLIAKRNKAAFSLRTPMAVLGVRGTDFAVVLTKGASARAAGALIIIVDRKNYVARHDLKATSVGR